MNRRDLSFFALGAALFVAFFWPTWFNPQKAMSNFGDLYAYHYPLRHLAFSSLEVGRLPFWNPYIFGGLPLAANPQSTLFYPVSLLGAIFPLPIAFSWDYLFHLLWAALGLGLLARRQGLSPASAWLLGFLYSFSPFLVYRVTEGIPTLLASLAWAPWCWLAWLYGGPGFLAASWSLQFFSGHPQFMFINILGMIVWALSRKRKGIGLLRRLALEGGPVAALAAVQWIPSWEFMSLSVRREWPEAFSLGYSLDWRTLWTWLHPGAWGTPIAGTYAGPPSVFFENSGVYIGPLGLALATLGLFKSRSKAGLLLIVLGLLLALGGYNPAYRWLMRGPVGFLRTPSRHLFLCLWGLLLTVGAGLLWLEQTRRLDPSWRAIAFVAAVLPFLVWDRSFLRSEDASRYLRPNPIVTQKIGGMPWRILTDPGLASPNKAMLYRSMNVGGYEAFYLGSFPAYAARSEGHPAVDASRTYMKRYDSPEMSRLGVAYFLSSDGRLILNPLALPLAYYADAAERPMQEPLSLSIERPERWVLRGRRPQGARRVILAQAFYPGWKAWLNGGEVRLKPWDGFLQNLELSDGILPGSEFNLRLDFEPRGWPLWAASSILSWLAWLALGCGRLIGRQGSKGVEVAA
jgi:hypothetical protein